jgi:hypothetical protein
LHERSLGIARRLGVTSFILWQEAEHVFHCHWEGRWDEALATVDEYLVAIGSAPTHYMEGACRIIRSAILLARGDPEAAREEARRATEVSRPVKDPQTINPSLAYEAHAALALGERAVANALANELVAAWHATGIRQPHECAIAPWVFRELGRAEELQEALERESRGATPWHEAARRVVSDDLAGAAEIFAEIGSVPDEAYARLRAAEERVAASDRREADRQLRLALPVFVRLGATAWSTEGEALLAESA